MANSRPIYGSRLKAERERRGLTQDDLAILSGYSVSTISRAERLNYCSPDAIDCIAKALKLASEALIASVLEPLRPQSRCDDLRSRIMDDICSGLISAEDRDILAKLHVMHTDFAEWEIKSVLETLQADGFVIRLRSGKYVLRRLTDEEIDKAYNRRLFLERMYIREAIYGPKDALHRIRERQSIILQRMTEDLLQGSFEGAFRRDVQFHLCWVAECPFDTFCFDTLLMIARQLMCVRILQNLDHDAQYRFVRADLNELKAIHQELARPEPNCRAIVRLVTSHIKQYKELGRRRLWPRRGAVGD